jgi:hypothetical protein
MFALPEAAKEHAAVAKANAGRDEPLAAVLEKKRAENLDEDQGNEQVSDAAHGTGHDGPTVVQGAALLSLFIAPEGHVLERAKNDTDGATRYQGEQNAGDIHNHKLQHNFFSGGILFQIESCAGVPPLPRSDLDSRDKPYGALTVVALVLGT